MTSPSFGFFVNASTSAPVSFTSRFGAGRVVGVRVREQHPADALAHRRADDGVDVAGVVGAGVDHRDLVDADEVGVGAGPGERARGSAATMRRTSGDSALGTPGVMSGTTTPLRTARARRTARA